MLYMSSLILFFLLQAPGFYDPSLRLNQSNANFVDIIHTSMVFGLQVSLGHHDFWPNGGLSQPGCLTLLDIPGVCDHMRATDLYAESILSPLKFQTSTECSLSIYWQAGFCNCKSNCNRMGHYANRALKSPANFFLSTNAQAPFSMS